MGSGLSPCGPAPTQGSHTGCLTASCGPPPTKTGSAPLLLHPQRKQLRLSGPRVRPDSTIVPSGPRVETLGCAPLSLRDSSSEGSRQCGPWFAVETNGPRASNRSAVPQGQGHPAQGFNPGYGIAAPAQSPPPAPPTTPPAPSATRREPPAPPPPRSGEESRPARETARGTHRVGQGLLPRRGRGRPPQSPPGHRRGSGVLQGLEHLGG